ncbi:MAG: glycosyltransferase family 4 protein [Phycisphaeraceae bacterium]
MNLIYSLPFWPYLYTPWLFREMQWMRKRGHRVAVISLGDPPGPRANPADFGLQDVPVLRVDQRYQGDGTLFRLLTAVAARGFKGKTTQSLATMRRDKGLRHGLHDWLTQKRVMAFVKQQRADVIEAHWAAHSAMLARDIFLATGIPYALRIHGGDMHKNPSPRLQDMVQDAAAVCPVSRFIADLLLGKRPVASLPQVPPVSFDLKKMFICHNGVPAGQIAAEPAPQSETEQIIGTIGRLDDEKRHEDLLRAVGRIKDKHPGLKLLFIGGGVLEPSLRALAAELGIADRLTITGPLPWEHAMAARKKIHIYAHMSKVEGCSLAVAEGLAQGVPAVLSRVGAAVDSIDEGVNGYTIDIGDVAAMASALDRIVTASPQARRDMGARSLAIIRERFCFEGLMERLEGILSASSKGDPHGQAPKTSLAHATKPLP